MAAFRAAWVLDRQVMRARFSLETGVDISNRDDRLCQQDKAAQKFSVSSQPEIISTYLPMRETRALIWKVIRILMIGQAQYSHPVTLD